MLTDAERMRLKHLFSDTISLLCRGGLPGACASRIDALIGVTLDSQEVVLVNFSENFVYENEQQTRPEINSEINCSQVTRKSDALATCGVKDECVAGTSQDLCNSTDLVPDRDKGYDILVPKFDINSHDTAEHSELQDVISSYQVSGIDSPVAELKQTSLLESDSDCLFMKIELPENDHIIKDVSAENFIVSSDNGIAVTSVPAISKSVYSSSSIRVKHIQNTQRRAHWNPYGSKFHRPRQRSNTVEHGALCSSQVICYSVLHANSHCTYVMYIYEHRMCTFNEVKCRC